MKTRRGMTLERISVFIVMLFPFILWQFGTAVAHQKTREISFSSEKPPTPTPRARSVGARSSNKPIITVLPAKARIAIGGGFDGDYSNKFCPKNVVYSEGTEMFTIYPETGIVELNKPHAQSFLVVDPCHIYAMPVVKPGRQYTYTLIAPNGRVLNESEEDLWQQYGYFKFGTDAQPGQYALTIEGPSALYTRTLEVAPYAGPKLTLIDSVTRRQVDQVDEAQIDNGIVIDLVGFSPNTTHAIGLYFDAGDGNSEWVLIDAWLADTDRNSRYREQLVFHPEMPEGFYRLQACALDNCQLSFSGLEGPLGSSNTIGGVSIVWEEFIASNTPATVSVTQRGTKHNFR